MTVAGNTPEPAWRVVPPQRQETRSDATGRFVEGWVVSFQTRGGHTGAVFVPLAQYTAQNVSAAISRAAATIDQVGNLQG